jgi:uncharacterized caspase-like protein
MIEAIRKFTSSLDEQSVGLFYFAGHGIEFGGDNYLIPVDANIVNEADVEFESINAGGVLSGLKQSNNGLNLVILDACWNNPYARSFRSASRGLSRMQPASGSLILYATEPGNVASDGTGDNGVFTTHFVDAINQDGLSIEKVFKITARNVSKATAKKQTPYIEGVVLGDFYFSGSDKAETTPVQTASISDDVSGEHERLFWNEVKADPRKEMYDAYLQQYPNGHYALIANIKLNQLNNKTDTTAGDAQNSSASVIQPDSGIDVTGTYTTIYKSVKYTNRPEVVLTQVGDKITGVITPDKGYGLEGKLEGNTIKYTRYGRNADIRGTWKISEDGNILNGDWYPSTGSNYGTWELTKVK